jgi:hypothetical protein
MFSRNKMRATKKRQIICGEDFRMPKSKTASKTATTLPLLKTVEQMAVLSGIGENRLRSLIAAGEIDYVMNGNRRMLTEQAIVDWYNRTKITARASLVGE